MYYHGTDKDSARTIVETQSMRPSEGDSHWLGDGYYFYVDVEYAFRWILIKYTRNFSNEFSEDYGKIYEEYAVVSAELNIEEDRLFSMEDIKHKIIFIDTKKALCEKAEQSGRLREIIRKNSMVDGVVFNYLFKYARFGEKFDAVKAIFPISYCFDNSRMEFLPEPQICVKNVKIISDYKKYSEDIIPDEYKEFIEKYNQIKDDLKIKRLSKYKAPKKSIKYKKEELTR